jgi:hypothetical protein
MHFIKMRRTAAHDAACFLRNDQITDLLRKLGDVARQQRAGVCVQLDDAVNGLDIWRGAF